MNTTETLKNGLTREQVYAARAIISKISLKALCEEQGIPMTTVYNVLRDSSSRVDLLKKVLDSAYDKIEERKKLLASIPAE
jgi:predicted transcriptional regulator